MKCAALSGLLFGLLLAAFVVESPAQLAAGSGGRSTASGEYTPPPEDCFDSYLAGAVFCKTLYCQTLWFLWYEWESCDDEGLTDCLDDADDLLDACLAGQNP